jgi:hypothetical protein
MKLLRTAALTCALAFSAHFAQAQIATPQANGFVGLLAGYVDTTNIDGTFGYGVNAGMMFPNGWNGLVWAFNSTSDVSGTDVNLFQYGIGVDYSLRGIFGDNLGMLRGGMKVGASTVDVDAPGTDAETDFVFGPTIGGDWMFTETFSLGGEADLLFVTKDGGYSTLYLFATAKYWF